MNSMHRPADDTLDPLSVHRAERLGALLAEIDDADALRRSAERMRPAVLAAAQRTATRGRRVRWLSAAAVAILSLTVAAVPPLRALVVEQVRSVLAAAGIGSPPTQRAPDIAPNAGTTAAPDAAVRLAFAVRGSVLSIDAGSAQGALLVRRTSAAAASIEASGAPDARFVVLHDGIRVEGTTGVGAVFALEVPQHVSRVLLLRSGRAHQELSVAGPAELRVELAR